MQAFAGREAEKLTHLRQFHKYLRNPAFHMTGIGEGDEAFLLENFFHVNAVFASLPAVDQDVIADICARMGTDLAVLSVASPSNHCACAYAGEGMASYCGRDLREGTVDLKDYNLCALA